MEISMIDFCFRLFATLGIIAAFFGFITEAVTVKGHKAHDILAATSGLFILLTMVSGITGVILAIWS